MFSHVNPKNGEKAPLIDEKVYEIIMEVRTSPPPGRVSATVPGARLVDDLRRHLGRRASRSCERHVMTSQRCAPCPAARGAAGQRDCV